MRVLNTVRHHVHGADTKHGSVHVVACEHGVVIMRFRIFVIENILSGKSEGLIAIYDVKDGKAEWGRWVVKKDSVCAVESFCLLCRAAFEKLGLKELYCRTIQDNIPVVSFHESVKQKNRGALENFFTLNGKKYNAVEHYMDKEYFYSEVLAHVEKLAHAVFERSLRAISGGLEFHHIAVACKNIERDFAAFKFLGYAKEGLPFNDPLQGVKGQFIAARGQPKLELLENLPGSNTLTPWLENGNKMYHFAYTVKDIETAAASFAKNRIKLVSPAKDSVYFGKKICFLMLTNMYMIELIEK